MRRIGVLTSGGDAPGMNAAIRAVVRHAIGNDMSVVGFKRGFNGILMKSRDQNDDYQFLTSRSVSDKIHRGGTFLMTARCSEFKEVSCQKKAIENMRMLGVEGLVCIGGDGTLRGANDLNELGFPTIGIPGTIDNDLPYTDFSIGFDTALDTACDLINRIRETSDSHERVSLVTVMGRNCGDIAVHTALACGAEIVMIPEVAWSVEAIADRVKWGVMRGKHSMIMIFAEGAMNSLTSDLPALLMKHEALNDISPNHLTASQLALIIETLSGHETRATVLGYTQRGGSPSAVDRILASRLGARAVELLRDDVYGKCVGIHANKIIEVPFSQMREGCHDDDGDLLRLVDDLAN